MLEGRNFSIFTDQKPLTSAFFKAKDPISNRQRNELNFISEFCTEVAHVSGLQNILADTLSRQHSMEQEIAVVNTIAHRLTDLNLEELAREQDGESIKCEIGEDSALNVKKIQF